MKKLYLLLFIFGFVINASAQQQWITLTNDHPAAPGITLGHSLSSGVAYTIDITGMYKQDSTVNTVTYSRLSILQNGKWGAPGYPELPAIYKLIAVPEYESVSVTYNVIDSVILNGYNVYPAPAIVVDSSNGIVHNIEVFTKNDSVYATNGTFPESAYEILETSYFRSQKMLRVAAYPFRYNPVSNTLVVYTHFEVVLSFSNPQSEINVNLGYFSNIAKNTLLNYQSDQIPVLPAEPAAIQGMVQWITMTDTAEAATIDADYLIITDHQFFEPHSLSLLRIANHRASFNGFDIAIVDVQNILSPQLPFIYNTSTPQYINEQKIRSFIKRVYEGANAHHMYDGKLGFVLLVGDALGNTAIAGVPAARDPALTSGIEYCDNDYYYSCITHSNGNWDKNGDLFIGRFCADDETELLNVVNKTCKYENEYNFDSWRKNNTLAFGGGGLDEQKYFCEDFRDWLNSLYQPVYTTTVMNAVTLLNWNQDYISHINGTGSNIVINYGHGKPWSWCNGDGLCDDLPNTQALAMNYKKNHLSNSGKNPFVISNACNTNVYSNLAEGDDCIGEEMAVYSSENGYVAYIGCWNKSGLTTTSPGKFPSMVLGAYSLCNIS